METSEEGKMSMLRKAFHSGLAKALEPINQQVDKHARVEDQIHVACQNIVETRVFVLQEFHKCFPSFDTRHAMAFYDLYRQVSVLHR